MSTVYTGVASLTFCVVTGCIWHKAFGWLCFCSSICSHSFSLFSPLSLSSSVPELFQPPLPPASAGSSYRVGRNDGLCVPIYVFSISPELLDYFACLKSNWPIKLHTPTSIHIVYIVYIVHSSCVHLLRLCLSSRATFLRLCLSSRATFYCKPQRLMLPPRQCNLLSMHVFIRVMRACMCS